MVVALDEFQAIDAFNGGSVEHALRAAAQHQRQVGYVFAGSEPSLMEQMIGPRRPFYKAGPVMRLEKIPADVFAGVHRSAVRDERHPRRSRASAPRSSISPATCPTTCSGSRTRPGTTCAASGRTARDARRSARDARPAAGRAGDAVRGCLAAAHAGAARACCAPWSCRAAASCSSADTRAPHRLGGPSSIQASLAALSSRISSLKEGGRYVVVDSLLREWVARRDLLSVTAAARLLARLGLDRPELRAWAMYDWANSAFRSTVITAVFPALLRQLRRRRPRRRRWPRPASPGPRRSRVTIVALIGPILGAHRRLSRR